MAMLLEVWLKEVDQGVLDGLKKFQGAAQERGVVRSKKGWARECAQRSEWRIGL